MFKSPPLRKIMGFTLVELSIVIVVIGLIIGVVTAGQSLVRQAQIRSVLNDVNKYKTAWNAFKLQYDALPGDYEMLKATGLTQ
jgi:prepilin-type N-terminal cleavage/methylation domain-containing protein